MKFWVGAFAIGLLLGSSAFAGVPLPLVSPSPSISASPSPSPSPSSDAPVDITPLVAAASSTEPAPVPDNSAKPTSVLCSDGRLSIMNFELRYRKLLEEARPNMSDSDPSSIISALRDLDRDPQHPENDSEVCRWNRFLLVDFLIYFDILDKISPAAPAQKPALLELRNSLYSEWMEKVKYGVDTHFAEWEKEDLKDESLDDFLARGSEQFHSVQRVVNLFYRRPKAPKDPNNLKKELDYQVKVLLQARTPFSSITTDVAYADAQKSEVASTVSCTLKALKYFSCNENLYEEALACAAKAGAPASRQRDLALETLGVYASQRMYLMRDLKAWMEQNLDRTHFDSIFQVFEDGSEIYFLLESIGNQCGVDAVYPKDDGSQPGDHVSVKSYHYWSEAFLTSHLVEEGFPADLSIKAALKPAHKYKAAIRFVGFIYNLLLGTNPLSAETKDYKSVIKEQKLGACFGTMDQTQLNSADMTQRNK